MQVGVDGPGDAIQARKNCAVGPPDRIFFAVARWKITCGQVIKQYDKVAHNSQP